jgi:hypothetical protein
MRVLSGTETDTKAGREQFGITIMHRNIPTQTPHSSPLSFVDTHNSHLSEPKAKNAISYARIITSPLLYYMYLHPFCYNACYPRLSPCPSSQATKLSLLISLLTNTPLSSPSLGCRRCEKSGNSYFVPGCSTLRLGSNRRKNAVKGREGDAGDSEWLKWVVMAGEVEALEHVARELFCMSVFDSKRRVFAWQAYLSVVAIQEDFLHRDLLELPLESPPRCEEAP